MKIVLYSTDKRTNDLTPPPSGGVELNVEIRGGINLTNPTLELRGFDDYYKYNYVYVERWNRYYFIANWTVNGNIQYLNCEEDYLTTWYDTLINTRYFCLRSTSRYDEQISDTRFPAHARVRTIAQNLESPWQPVDKGRYIIGIASGGNGSSHVGTNCYYVLTTNQMTQFMNDLMGNIEFSLSGITEGIAKTMINPLQYIQSCHWIPWDVDAHTQDVSEIDFGWWSSETTAKILVIEENEDCTTEFDIRFEATDEMTVADREYLKYPPYSSLSITAYPFGTISVSQEAQSVYMSGTDLIARVILDNITGMGTLVIRADRTDNPEPLYLTTAQVGVEIPVGQILQDFAGSAIQTAGAVGMGLTGNVLGATAGIYNALDSAAPQATISGTVGGFAQLMLDDPWTLLRSYRTVSIEGDLVGEPCCHEYLLGALEGYAIFAEADIVGNMLADEKEAIKGLLTGGIFIA